MEGDDPTWEGQVKEHSWYSGRHITHLQPGEVAQQDVHGQASQASIMNHYHDDDEVLSQCEGVDCCEEDEKEQASLWSNLEAQQNEFLHCGPIGQLHLDHIENCLEASLELSSVKMLI